MPRPVHHPYDVTHSTKGQEHQGKLVLDVSRASSLRHGHVEEALLMLTLCPCMSSPHKGALWGRPEGENSNGYLSQHEETQKS